MGEHLPCKQGVMSSNLTISTKVKRKVAAPEGLRTSVQACLKSDVRKAFGKGILRIPVMSETRSVCESRGYGADFLL